MKATLIDQHRAAFAVRRGAVAYNYRPGSGKFSMAGPVFPDHDAPGRGE